MAPKPNVPPVNRPGQKHFNVANLDKMNPEQRKKILGHIVDLMDDEDTKDEKEHPTKDQNEEPPE